MSQKYLVTGAGGYIGSVLCEMLIKRGMSVVGVDRYFFGLDPMNSILDSSQFKLCKKDIRALSIEDLKDIDVVIHLASLSNDPSADLDPQLTYSINQESTLQLVKTAKDAGVHRFLFASSCSIYGASSNSFAIREDGETRPVSHYAKSKCASEKEILPFASDDFIVTILRNATVFGLSPRMRFDLVINVMTAYAWRDGQVSILGGGKQRRPLIHVKDVSRAFIMLAEAEPKKVNREVYNVGDDNQNYRVFQIANMIKNKIPNTKLIRVPDDTDPRDYHVSFEKIHDTFSFKATVSPEEAVDEIVEALNKGLVDFDDPKTNTMKFYQSLLNAERLFKEVAIDGSIF